MSISQKNKRSFNVKPSTYYFHMKTKILVDFQICISAPLTLHEKKKDFSKSILKASENVDLFVSLL